MVAKGLLCPFGRENSHVPINLRVETFKLLRKSKNLAYSIRGEAKLGSSFEAAKIILITTLRI